MKEFNFFGHSSLKKITDAIFNQPFLYERLRPLFLGGLPIRDILDLLEANGSDIILDVGCGTGYMAEKIGFSRYTGIDNDPRMIKIAQNRKIPNAEFVLQDIRKYNFADVGPTKIVLYGVLHHLNDRDAIELLKLLAHTTKQFIVSLDPVYAKYHLINNILCELDRGAYVRTEEDMITLISQTKLRVESKLVKYANTFIAKYLVLRLIPEI